MRQSSAERKSELIAFILVTFFNAFLLKILNPESISLNFELRVTFKKKLKAFVKKIGYSNQEYRGWAFGNNFHGRYQNYCVVSTPNLKVEMKKKFMCLCAR